MATNMYLKFEDPSITGASQAPDHKGEIEVLSWSHGFAQPTNPSRSQPGTGPVEQAAHSNFTFTKYIDSSSNELLKFCWSGKQIKKATLTCYRADGVTDNKLVAYLTVVMEHVVISNFSISGGAGDVPVENVALDYGIIEYKYEPEKQEKSSNKVLSAKHNLQTGVVE